MRLTLCRRLGVHEEHAGAWRVERIKSPRLHLGVVEEQQQAGCRQRQIASQLRDFGQIDLGQKGERLLLPGRLRSMIAFLSGISMGRSDRPWNANGQVRQAP
jgi:hypothetical protein